MATTVFDSVLFRDMFGTPEMREVFSNEAYLQRCIDTETALARAQAKSGLIPEEAARDITARADFAKLDLDALHHETKDRWLSHLAVGQAGERDVRRG